MAKLIKFCPEGCFNIELKSTNLEGMESAVLDDRDYCPNCGTIVKKHIEED